MVSYPRTPGSEPVTLTPTIIEKKLESEEGQTIVIYAALAQVILSLISEYLALRMVPTETISIFNSYAWGVNTYVRLGTVR